MNAGGAPRGYAEPFHVRWCRRAVTIPGYLLAALVLLSVTPILLPVVVVADVVRRRNFALVRSLLMVDVYLLAEALGILASLVIWTTSGGWRREASAAYSNRNFALQCRWASVRFWSARRIFGLRLEVEGEQCVRTGPLVVIGRHVSPIDNLVPAAFVSAAHGIRLRWVINRWLLRDPCLDIVGNRLPNLFVDAGRVEPGGQASRVTALAEGLGPNEGVFIYPEGALFNTGRRARVIARLATTDRDASQRAEALQHVLAPRTGGFVAALAAAPEADVVICSHTGLEPAGSYRAFISGALVGARVRIQFRRVARQSIPADAPGQAEWLWRAWAEVDRWIAPQVSPATPNGGPQTPGAAPASALRGNPQCQTHDACTGVGPEERRSLNTTTEESAIQ
jgi:1-acyl-sn-glycerol-3-phosphate acyltransferase